ncbi:MAG: type II toxin-antitoxin system prevent-host-death family antitoxin [Gammaproteobacteria bacterium]|nr:type II toxin-antitoxin system prevent-host-death family antitoxin [Gammaproteobacteria bacterium]
MLATSKDLRFHTKELLDKARMGEEVIITYHGKAYAKIVPIADNKNKNLDSDFCGMWKDREDLDDVDGFVRQLRSGRDLC